MNTVNLRHAQITTARLRDRRSRGADLMDCPGAWYGNGVGSFLHDQGNIVVDVAKIVEAIRWLSRRYTITYTEKSSRENDGIAIGIQRKTSR